MIVDTVTRVVVESPYQDNIKLFNNPDTSDMNFMVPGMETPLKLHCKIMSTTSNFVKYMMTQQEGGTNTQGRGWNYDMSKEADRNALTKVMRFCYGERMEIGAENGECCAVIAELYRLQVTCAEEAVKKIGFFALEVSKRNLGIGMKLLRESSLYPECCTELGCGLDKALSQIVFSPYNIYRNYDIVVGGCLMKLPSRYLEMVGYGEPHTKFSEFNIRMEYVKQNMCTLSNEEKESVMKGCDWKELKGEELKRLRQLDVMKDKELLDAYQEVLDKTEKELDELKLTGVKTKTDRPNEESELKSNSHITDNFYHVCFF